MLVLNGEIRRGLNAAHRTLELQLPEIIKTFPEVSRVHWGTLNIALREPLRIAKPDYSTPPIHWYPQDRLFSEIFGFTRIHLEIKGEKHRSWIYQAQHSPHNKDLFHLEIVAEEIKGLKENESCKIYLDRDFREEAIRVVQ